ncbi:MAG: hydrogenase/urease nickel incorporation protein [Siphoviridae sp. ctjeG17]|nr:MAG: hydrogenase/urease nickel incorporation protein [Siphoviridae sp. ctjeG17]
MAKHKIRECTCKCGYGWVPRVPQPKKCPRCGVFLDGGKKQ